MKVEVEDLNSVKKVLHIEIPEERVAREIDKAYNTLKKTAKIKGFRPGKAPRAILENIYSKNVLAEVSNTLLQESFPEAVKETNLNILGNPQVDPPELEGKGPYAYDVTIEIRPELEEIDFKGLKLKKTRYEIKDTQIDTQIEMLQKSQGKLEPIDETRALQEEDIAVIDYEAFKDGKPFADIQKAEGYNLHVGNGQITKEFDDQIIGLNPGENREIKITFPEDHANKQVANQEITFQTALKEIKKEVLPEINDVFAKKVGEFENLDALRADISENLKKGYDNRAEEELNGQIVEALIEKTDFEVPDTMIEYEIEAMIANMARPYAYQNISLEDLGLSKEVLSEQYREPAEKLVRRYLMLDKLIEQEGLNLSDDELEKSYKEISEQSNQPLEEIKAFYRQNNDRLDLLKHSLLEKSALELIIEHSEIEEVEPESETLPEDTKEE